MESEVLTVAEAAPYLRISRSTLSRLMRAGEIRFVKIGDRVLFRKAALDAFLEKQEAKSTPARRKS